MIGPKLKGGAFYSPAARAYQKSKAPFRYKRPTFRAKRFTWSETPLVRAAKLIWRHKAAVATGALAATQAYRGDYLGAGLTIGYHRSYGRPRYRKRFRYNKRFRIYPSRRYSYRTQYRRRGLRYTNYYKRKRYHRRFTNYY